MFVGHAVLAFALGAVGAIVVGQPRAQALQIGVIAALFAIVPDVDIVYALVGLLDGGGVMALADSFWRASTVVHRGVTHSVVIGTVAAIAFAGYPRHSRTVIAVLGGLVAGTALLSGGLAGFVMALYVLAGLAVARLAHHHTASPRIVVGAALVGLVSHPFGDVFTGTPPAFGYPLDFSVVSARIAPFVDPTLNLLFAFGVELAVIWVAVAVFAWLTERSVWSGVQRRAGFGAGYGVAALVLAPPTMTVSYHFVFSVLAVGVVGVAPNGRPWRPRNPWSTVVTGLAAVSVAFVAYAVGYLLLAG